MAQDPQSKKMLIQLLEGNDPSAEVDRSAIGRWHEYLDSYVLRQPTEWLPEHRDEGRSAIFLRRSLSSDDSIVGCSDMRIRIRPRTYKLLYEAGCEDAFMQRRSGEEERDVQERARRRNEDRRRCRLLVVERG
jgi:paired amphipathic helix protein Sin3a